MLYLFVGQLCFEFSVFLSVQKKVSGQGYSGLSISLHRLDVFDKNVTDSLTKAMSKIQF